MKTGARDVMKETRLDEIRMAAGQNTRPEAMSPLGAQSGRVDGSYYGLPALKGPVWTWEVPLYLFLGGIAGVSGCISFVAQLFRNDPALVRVSLWIALIAAGICPALLISDLGRPARFLNMLRVFKLRSPMSVGAWVLASFSGCVFIATFCVELMVRGFINPGLTTLLWVTQAGAAILGLLFAGYTGVLIGATAIPVWSQNRTLIPAHFLTSGLGCSAGILELVGFLTPATQVIGLTAAAIETVIAVIVETRKRRVDAPLHEGRSGTALRIAGLLEGPGALLPRVFLASTPFGRYAAASCFLIGALLSRYAWIWAGRASARDPEALFELQRNARIHTGSRT